MNFVPCLTWVKRGVAKEIPEKLQLSKSELKRLIEESIADIQDLKVKSDDDDDGSPEKEKERADQRMDSDIVDDDDVVNKYNLDSYDNESDPFESLAGLTTDIKESEETGNENVYDSDDEENYKIQPQDNLIAVGHVTDDCSTLEIYVYNDEDDDLYVHHEIILPAFPVCMEWLGFGPNEDKPSNYLAVGDMTPQINIWDLDMVEVMEPIAKLGKKLRKKDKKKKGSSVDVGHTDAVLDLSWNKNLSHALASGSADHTVILWDLSTTVPVTHLRHHKEKVQCVEWHPFEAEMLLTGSCDTYVTLYDARTLEEKKKWGISEEVEKIVWNHFDPFYFLVGGDQGNIYYFDVRHADPVFTIDAHSKGITDMSMSSSCPGLVASTASFTSFKIWDIRNNQPKLVDSMKLKQGNLLTCRSSPDSPFTFAFGGDKPSSNLKVLNLLKSEKVSNNFAPESVKSQAEDSVNSKGVTRNTEAGFDQRTELASSSNQSVPSMTERRPAGKKVFKKAMSKKKWK